MQQLLVHDAHTSEMKGGSNWGGVGRQNKTPTVDVEGKKGSGRKMLKVPKCENFDRFDFLHFYTIKSSCIGDFVVKKF